MSACKGCGKEIVWGETGDGKRIPLDPRPPVYDVTPYGDGSGHYAIRMETAMVSHFATCSKANDFSGSKPKAAS